MQSNEPTIINAAGVEMPVTNVVFHENFIIAYTDSISVRFEKVGDELQNGDFKITGDLSGFMPVALSEAALEEATITPEPTVEEEAVDVVVDPAAGTITSGEGITGEESTVEVTQPVTTE